MGEWNDYPDGNDHNVDMFAYFLSRYFALLENPNLKFDYSKENEFYPGMNKSLGMRIGQVPEFTKDDKLETSMRLYLSLFENYSKHINADSVIGFAISLARILNQEPFGVFNAKNLPKSNPFNNDINKYIMNLVVESKGGYEENIFNDLIKFFKTD